MSNLLDALDIDFSTLSFRDYWGPDKDYVFDQFKSKAFFLKEFTFQSFYLSYLYFPKMYKYYFVYGINIIFF